jgi:hypothetical protein
MVDCDHNVIILYLALHSVFFNGIFSGLEQVLSLQPRERKEDFEELLKANVTHRRGLSFLSL